MAALKPRHTDTPARPTESATETVRIVGAPHRPRPSPPREMREMLEARLNTSVVAIPEREQFGPFAKIAIVSVLATLAWTPIAAAAYVFSS